MVSLSGEKADTTPTARTTGAALTSDRLGEAWPEVSGRLRRMLASRGVDASLVDDIVQEVAVRALDKQVPFTDPADLYRWAATAARRLHIDYVRSNGRTTHDDALLAVPDTVDVAHAAERRVALGHVLRAMAVMRPGERDAILESLEEREARSSQALVRRHRARASLRKAVGGMLTTLVGIRLRLREHAPALQNAAGAAALAPALALGSAALAPAPGAPAPRGAVVAAPDRTVAPPAVRPVRRAAAAEPVATKPAAARPRRAVVAVPLAPVPDDPQEPNRRKKPPVVFEDVPNSEQKSVICVEQSREPVVCAPTLPPRPSTPHTTP